MEGDLRIYRPVLRMENYTINRNVPAGNALWKQVCSGSSTTSDDDDDDDPRAGSPNNIQCLTGCTSNPATSVVLLHGWIEHRIVCDNIL